MAPSKTGEQDPEARAQAEKKLGLRYLLSFAGPLKGLLYLGCGLSALSMLLSFGPFVCIWLVVRDLVAVAPNWSEAGDLTVWGWLAFWLAVASIALYFLVLLCTNRCAFRTASGIRRACLGHLMRTQLGYFDTHASGALRRIIDGSASSTEGLIAHKTPDTDEGASRLATQSQCPSARWQNQKNDFMQVATFAVKSDGADSTSSAPRAARS